MMLTVNGGFSLVGVSGVTLLIFALWKYYSWRYKLRHIKGPTPLPIIGNILQFGSNEALFKNISKWSEKFAEAGCFAIYAGWTPTIIIYNERDMEIIHRDTNLDRKSFQYYMLSDWLNDGLLMSTHGTF
ncbi:cytochrome P450 2C4-like [Apostichopus japonicus]|uniref:cytochrome P450 2C4-like n=1 Tax=Stichopus japonicus TaxID=307972 RepID=UPI003AB55EEF